jgi:transcriptional regulator with XRE-family HTH domain
MARQGLSQQALADKLGWLQSRLSRRIADGSKHTPVPFDVAELNEVASALGVPLARLLPASVTVA